MTPTCWVDLNVVHNGSLFLHLTGCAACAGELSSDDDFYLLAPSGLAVLQTTNSVFNRTLYRRLTPQVLAAACAPQRCCWAKGASSCTRVCVASLRHTQRRGRSPAPASRGSSS